MKLVFLLAILSGLLYADLIKPAITEVTFYNDKRVELSLQISIEAVMSNITTKYKNTKDAPSSDYYDKLRHLSPDELYKKYKDFQSTYLSKITFLINGKKVKFSPKSHFVDIVGYAKRPRKAVLVYEGFYDEKPKTLTWNYQKYYGENAFRFREYSEDSYTWSQWKWLNFGDESVVIDLSHIEIQSNLDRFLQFIKIGFEHVLPKGMDHIFFIIGMSIAVFSFRSLILLVSSFTLAHTLTLALSMLNILQISPRIIEPLIAFSIAFVAFESYMNTPVKKKMFIVFGFGLIHGMGFASMLKTFHMTKDNFYSTLIGFNFGVELAQLLIVSIVFTSLYLFKKYTSYTKYYINTVVFIIASIALYWTYDRIQIG